MTDTMSSPQNTSIKTHQTSTRHLQKPGDVVLTTFGVAVIISNREVVYDSHENQTISSYKVRLWRQPGKSIASSSVAYLQYDCILKPLPAAPGMIARITKTDATNTDVLIHCYSVRSDEYIVSSITERKENPSSHLDLVAALTDAHSAAAATTTSTQPSEKKNNVPTPIEWIYVSSHEISNATCAKFYPLIDTLISRGNKAAAFAQTVVNDNPKLQNITRKFSQMTSSLSTNTNNNNNDVENASKNHPLISKSFDQVSQVTDKMKEKITSTIPGQDEKDALYKMLRDEELTTLLSKGQERLEFLLSGGLNDSIRENLRDVGLEMNTDVQNASTTAIAQAQKRAVNALDDLLSNQLDTSLDDVQSSIGETFETMFDSLCTVAKTDPTLRSIVGDISEKTTEWQKMSGRLLSTRSSTLFMEGAQRLQKRLGNLLSPTQLALVDKAGADLTKSFTEGNLALARLKSIQLGESIRSRLFDAIEVRSETQGGLDSIIAGAISQVGGDSVGEMLKDFHDKASSSSIEANESLIALISERSQYQEKVVQRLEMVFVDLDSKLGDLLSTEEIASIASGEGGTAKIFEPLAKKATMEIEKQLDAAEGSIEDPTILNVISHVREIVTGQLTLDRLVSDIAKILESDDAVGTSAMIAQKGEEFLDAIENVSESTALGDFVNVVEKAGINKDSVLQQLESLNMDDVLDTAGDAVTDEKKRLELLSSATDLALDFLLKILPSMPIPPFEGVKDGLIYNIENLSMHGFKLKKDDIMVEIAGIRATQAHGSNNIVQREVGANQILIIDVQNISAVFEDAEWSFEQTYLPYLKGRGKATVNLSEGRIRKGFELKKMKKNNGETGWKPVLCLNDRSVSIDEINITFETSNRLQWVINKLAVIFKGPLRNYVVQVVDNILATKSGWLLEHLNGILAVHWDIILKTTGLSIDSLREVSKNDIVAMVEDPTANEIDLVWKEFLPLGINLVLNDKSGKIKVVDFPRGSQARKVCIDKQLDPDIFKGSTVVAINGYRFKRKDESQNRMDMMLALRDQSRPKTIKFRLDPEMKKTSNTMEGPNNPIASDTEDQDSNIVRYLNITKEGPIGLTFERSIDNKCLVVTSFDENGCAKAALVDNSVNIGDLLTHVNEICLLSATESIQASYEALQTHGASRPLRLGFTKPYLYQITMKKDDNILGGPHELSLDQQTKKDHNTGETSSGVYVKDYKLVDGVVEAHGVFLGDHLIFVNGQPVGSGHELRPDFPSLDLKEVAEMLKNDASYPICLTFARPQSDTRVATFDLDMLDRTISVVADTRDKLGFTIGIGQQPNHFVVKAFKAVVGSFQNAIIEKFGTNTCIGLRIYSIDGEVVPSYANGDIVMNAMKRAWSRKDQMELTFCDDRQHGKFKSLL